MDIKNTSMRDLYESWSDEQKIRFEFFVRSHLNRSKVRTILSNALGKSYTITEDMSIVAASLTKLYIGELVENALEIHRRTEQGETSTLSVESILESHRNLSKISNIRELMDDENYINKLTQDEDSQDLVILSDDSYNEHNTFMNMQDDVSTQIALQYKKSNELFDS